VEALCGTAEAVPFQNKNIPEVPVRAIAPVVYALPEAEGLSSKMYP
jgi:hypothetical protein